MLHILNVIDDTEMSYQVVNIDDIDYRAERTQSLRSIILYLLSFEQVFNSENKKNSKDLVQTNE